MVQYIIKDMTEVCCYLPYGLAAGLFTALLLSIVQDIRVRNNQKPFSVAAYTGVLMYLTIMLMISFFSRESGSKEGIDMQLLSTWGINNRNKAFFVENIIFFVPYGFLLAWAVRPARRGITAAMLGAVTSLVIESMQLVTGRGVFQIDDIVTNTAGALAGCLLFGIVVRIGKAARSHAI